MSERMSVILTGPLQRRTAHAYVDAAPDGYVCELRPKTRSLEANAKVHAELTEIARTIPWAGKLRSVECWKRLLTAAFLRARGESVEVLPALDGHGIDVVFSKTSQMSVREVSDLLEYVAAWRSEQEVTA